MEKLDKLYVRFEIPKTPEEFFKRFYNFNNMSYNSSETYYDKECTDLQCESSCNRSFSDLYVLFKTYYENITQNELLRLFFDINKNDNFFNNEKDYKLNIRFNFCFDIDRSVLNLTFLNKVYTNSFNLSYASQVGEDGLNWEQIFNNSGIDIINICDEEDDGRYNDDGNVIYNHYIYLFNNEIYNSKKSEKKIEFLKEHNIF